MSLLSLSLSLSLFLFPFSFLLLQLLLPFTIIVPHFPPTFSLSLLSLMDLQLQLQAVLHFLRTNGFSLSERALNHDLQLLSSSHFYNFLFPMNPPLPRLTTTGPGSAPDSSGEDDFKSFHSSTTVAACSSSDLTNPCGATQGGSDTSSDRLSQFGTARDYHEFDTQPDFLWYDDKDDGSYMTPSFSGSDSFGCPSQDKFVMTLESGKISKNPFCSHDPLSQVSKENDLHLEYPFQPHYRTSSGHFDNDQVKDCYHLDENVHPDEGGVKWDLRGAALSDAEDLEAIMKELEARLSKLKVSDTDPVNGQNARDAAAEVENSKTTYESCKKDSVLNNYGPRNDKEVVLSSEEPNSSVEELEETTTEEIPYWETNEDEYEVFTLRIVHRKNRTGFEEIKDFQIVLNTIVAGRYYITEYLGSAAFSKVVQAHDIHNGVDVCLKIIKNDKDFFDQSLDEIKLLKYVNRHDPADEHHIIRLYDYFYHQEHLFIVCELLRANLYEFQKYNLESGGEPYFTMPRLQAIARQCLEALDYLHGLGIIHCDLKPENILIKSYGGCEIKVIDLGSSCFQTDNLCLYVQSRSYRAPEVILGLPYDPKIDIWSLGCIMAELCSGELLFPNDGIVMLLARMIGLLGPIDLEMLLQGQDTHKYFTKEYDLYHIHEDTNQVEFIIPEQSSLEQHLPVFDDGFMDFVKYLLHINPRHRPTARQALQHPWLSFPYQSQ